MRPSGDDGDDPVAFQNQTENAHWVQERMFLRKQARWAISLDDTTHRNDTVLHQMFLLRNI